MVEHFEADILAQNPVQSKIPIIIFPKFPKKISETSIKKFWNDILETS